MATIPLLDFSANPISAMNVTGGAIWPVIPALVHDALPVNARTVAILLKPNDPWEADSFHHRLPSSNCATKSSLGTTVTTTTCSVGASRSNPSATRTKSSLTVVMSTKQTPRYIAVVVIIVLTTAVAGENVAFAKRRSPGNAQMLHSKTPARCG